MGTLTGLLNQILGSVLKNNKLPTDSIKSKINQLPKDDSEPQTNDAPDGGIYSVRYYLDGTPASMTVPTKLHYRLNCHVPNIAFDKLKSILSQSSQWSEILKKLPGQSEECKETADKIKPDNNPLDAQRIINILGKNKNPRDQIDCDNLYDLINGDITVKPSEFASGPSKTFGKINPPKLPYFEKLGEIGSADDIFEGFENKDRTSFRKHLYNSLQKDGQSSDSPSNGNSQILAAVPFSGGSALTSSSGGSKGGVVGGLLGGGGSKKHGGLLGGILG